jgi:hypothetical protein
MPRSLPSKPAVAVLAGLGVIAAGMAAAAGLLRFDLDRLLFPRTPPPAALGGVPEAFRLSGQDGAAMVVRRFDRALVAPVRGCVVYFPGRQGGLDRYASELFPELQRAGLAVYAVAYPGQDGAPGRARLDDVQAMAVSAASRVAATCGRRHTVVAGRSLGAMVAAYAAGGTSPAGLVMESASPSLSAGVRAALHEHWFLRPFALLPIERLVAHDFSLAEAIPAGLHAVVFQGTDDARTPLADFGVDDGGGARVPVVAVAGGNHADTLERARPAMIAAMLGMIRGSEEAAAAEGDDE